MNRFRLLAITSVSLLLVALGVAYYFYSREETYYIDTIEGEYDESLLSYENIIRRDSVADSLYFYLKDSQPTMLVGTLNNSVFYLEGRTKVPPKVIDVLYRFDPFGRWRHLYFEKDLDTFYFGGHVKISSRIDGFIILSGNGFVHEEVDNGYLLAFEDHCIRSIVKICERSFIPGDSWKTKIKVDSQHIFHYRCESFHGDVIHGNIDDCYNVRIVDFHYDENGYIIVHNPAQ